MFFRKNRQHLTNKDIKANEGREDGGKEEEGNKGRKEEGDNGMSTGG